MLATILDEFEKWKIYTILESEIYLSIKCYHY